MSATIAGRASEAAQDRLATGFADYMNRTYPEFRWEGKRSKCGVLPVAPAGKVVGSGTGRENDDALVKGKAA